MSTNTTTEATPDQPVISALEPVDEIEPELSERLEDETEEDDRFKPGLYNITVYNMFTSMMMLLVGFIS